MDAAAAFDQARMLAARGSEAEALAAIDALLAEAPEHVGALLLKGGLLLEARHGEEALVLCERASRVAPTSETFNALARCLHALARNEDALAAARQAERLLPEGDNFRFAAPVYLTLVWCLREMRRYKEALAAAEAGLSRMPDAVLAQWASLVEEELAEAEKEEC